MPQITKGSKTSLTENKYSVTTNGTKDTAQAIDLLAILLQNGRVRSDEDLVFFNHSSQDGVVLREDGSFSLDLSHTPANVDRIVIAASTEAQGIRFGQVPGFSVTVASSATNLTFQPENLTTESVVQIVAFYRRGDVWKLDAIGQGYDAGLAAFATDHGIIVDDPGTAGSDSSPAPLPSPQVASTPSVAKNSIDMRKVKVTLSKDSPTKIAKIDLRKSRGEAGWVLTVGLEWDGRGAKYNNNGQVTKFGEGDLDVYFYCRNEDTGNYVIISGEKGHQGSLDKWPFILHSGDSRGPGSGGRPAVEQVKMLPNENGDILVNVYQSVDNGTGALNAFGKPRVVVRYGRGGRNGIPGSDADEITVHPGNGRNSYWAVVAHIDVQDGILTVDGQTKYSRPHSEKMPCLSPTGKLVREPLGGPTGQSKRKNGLGLDRYQGTCPTR